MDLSCLTNIFGLSLADCACFPKDGLGSINITDSTTGLYLQEMEGMPSLNMIDASKDCGAGNIYKMMDLARKNAINEVATAIMLKLGSRYKKKHQPFKGVIGETAWTNNLSLTPATREYAFVSKKFTGMRMQIKRIALMGTGATPVAVTVYKQLPNGLGGFHESKEELKTVELVTGSASPIYAETENFFLPLDGSRYAFSYEYDGTYTVRDNKLGCGCGGRPSEVFKYISGQDSSSAYGFVLDAEVICNASDLICLNANTSEEMRLALGYAAMYKAGQKLIIAIANSNQINRYTMTSTTELQASLNMYQTKYDAMIEWIVSTGGIDVSLSDCLQCEPRARVVTALG